MFFGASAGAGDESLTAPDFTFVPFSGARYRLLDSSPPRFVPASSGGVEVYSLESDSDDIPAAQPTTTTTTTTTPTQTSDNDDAEMKPSPATPKASMQKPNVVTEKKVAQLIEMHETLSDLQIVLVHAERAQQNRYALSLIADLQQLQGFCATALNFLNQTLAEPDHSIITGSTVQNSKAMFTHIYDSWALLVDSATMEVASIRKRQRKGKQECGRRP